MSSFSALVTTFVVLLAVPFGALASDCAVEIALQDPSGESVGAGITVRFIPRVGSMSVHTTMANESSVEFSNVPCGDARVESGIWYENRDAQEFLRWSADSITLNADKTSVLRVNVMHRVPVTVTVRELDGRPIVAGEVAAWREQDLLPEFPAQIATPVGEDGQATLWLPTGVYGVKWFLPGHANSKPDIQHVSVNGTIVEYPRWIPGPGNEQAKKEDARVKILSFQVLGALTAVANEPVSVDFIASMKRLRQLKGLVQTKAGDGIPGIRLEYLATDYGPYFWTDENGAFEIYRDDFPLDLRPHDDSGAWKFIPETLRVFHDTSGPFVFTAVPSGEQLVGRIIDRLTGQGIGGVRMDFIRDCEGAELEGDTKSGPDGSFLLPCIPGCRFEMDTHRQSDYLLHPVSNHVVESCDQPLIIELDPGGIVTGIVLGPDGVPVPSLELAMTERYDMLYFPLHKVATSAGGAYRFSGLDPGEKYLLKLGRTVSDGGKNWYLADASNGENRLPTELFAEISDPPSAITWNLQLLRGGRVCVDGRDPDGNAQLVEEVDLAHSSLRSMPFKFDRRDGMKNGWCTAGVPAGTYRVMAKAHHDLYAPEWKATSAPAVMEIEVATGATVTVGPMTLLPGHWYQMLLRQSSPFDLPLRVEVAAATDAHSPGSDLQWIAVPPERVQFAEFQNRDGHRVSYHLYVSFAGPASGDWWVRACPGKECKPAKAWILDTPASAEDHSNRPIEMVSPPSTREEARLSVPS